MTAALPKSAWSKVATAMTEQVDRVKRATGDDNTASIRQLKADNLRLQERIEYLEGLLQAAEEAGIGATIARNAEGRGKATPLLNGRPVGSQSDYAKFYRVEPYQVSRWVKGGKLQAQGKQIYLDQQPPARTGRGRKSRA